MIESFIFTLLGSLTCPYLEEFEADSLESISVACNKNNKFAYAVSYWLRHEEGSFILLFDPQRNLLCKLEGFLQFPYERPLGKFLLFLFNCDYFSIILGFFFLLFSFIFFQEFSLYDNRWKLFSLASNILWVHFFHSCMI